MHKKQMLSRHIATWIVCAVLCAGFASAEANSAGMPFAPGERLEYDLRWENVPAGKARMEVSSIKTFNGEKVYHFVLTAQSNAFIDLFYKVRDRIDAYADLDMTCSRHYEKRQHEGRHKKDIVVTFDWENSRARYSSRGRAGGAIELLEGSFDPLSAFYFSRTIDLDVGHQLERPITDGKKNVIGQLNVIGRETITLQNGDRYDTYLVEPELNQVSGVFKESKGAKIRIWVTADERRIPVRVMSKVVVGHFIGELISAETVH